MIILSDPSERDLTELLLLFYSAKGVPQPLILAPPLAKLSRKS
jgi:hypothetical protein